MARFFTAHIALVEVKGVADNKKSEALWLTRTIRTRTKIQLKRYPPRNASFSRSAPAGPMPCHLTLSPHPEEQ